MLFEAIFFDCDGVLVDSEHITNRALHTMLNASGWAISEAECLQIFIGKTVRSETARIERETGQPLTDAWMAAFYALRDQGLHAHLQAIPGAVAAVQQCHALLGGKIFQSYDITLVIPGWEYLQTPFGTWTLFGEMHLVSSTIFDVGVYLIVIGVVLDLTRSLGAGIDIQIRLKDTANTRFEARRRRLAGSMSGCRPHGSGCGGSSRPRSTPTSAAANRWTRRGPTRSRAGRPT